MPVCVGMLHHDDSAIESHRAADDDSISAAADVEQLGEVEFAHVVGVGDAGWAEGVRH